MLVSPSISILRWVQADVSWGLSTWWNDDSVMENKMINTYSHKTSHSHVRSPWSQSVALALPVRLSVSLSPSFSVLNDALSQRHVRKTGSPVSISMHNWLKSKANNIWPYTDSETEPGWFVQESPYVNTGEMDVSMEPFVWLPSPRIVTVLHTLVPVWSGFRWENENNVCCLFWSSTLPTHGHS